MPRLPPSLLLNARQIHPFLPLILHACRTIPSALSEFRWLREHAIKLSKAGLLADSRSTLYQLCLRRSRSEPLQYILGDQPFGDLEILCKPGVLIPRLETEAYIITLAQLLRQKRFKSKILSHAYTNDRSLKILDLCTGTGCIPLLLHALLTPHIKHLSILGIDISAKAISLAKKNREWNIKRGKLQPIAREQIRFTQGDILDRGFYSGGSWDIMISNPPYISPRGFDEETSRSVRNYEPKLALVPPVHHVKIAELDESRGDRFYPRLLEIASEANVQVLLMEIDGHAQASRVGRTVHDTKVWEGYNAWRDELGNSPVEGMCISSAPADEISCIGTGRERAIVCWRGDGGTWLGLRHV